MNNLEPIEQQVLARLLASPELYWDVADQMTPAHFHDAIWKAVWTGLDTCHKEGSFDLHLVETNAPYEGDADLVARIKSLAAKGRKLTAAIEDLTKPLFNRRNKELIAETFLKGQKALNGDTRAIKLAEDVIEELQAISGHAQQANVVSLGESAEAVYESAAQPETTGGEAFSTGIRQVDDLLGGGLVDGELTVIGAEGAAGKTALALQIGEYIACEYGPVDFQSKEMTAEQLTMRRVAAMSGISTHAMRRGGLSADDLEKIYLAKEDCKRIPLYIDSTAKTTIEQLHIRAKANMARYGTRVLFVDSVKAMRVKDARLDANLPARCGFVISELKELAKTLEIPVVALAHEVRTEREPLQRLTRKELFGGSNMEDSADNILILFRPEPILLRKEPKEGTELHVKWQTDLINWKNRAQVHADKVRMGSGGRCAELVFDGPTTTFREDRGHQDGMLL
ncbi:Replicative DNA helicase [Pseudovibrio sp. Ad13]|uniref:DnaB-like helicase C-terminal domain-containing protein n=1 Tax=Pseudovibrio sp. Ad13 TaxID=989396 RepID=UPI0007AE3E5A|nr:DnaB-like helicase C-terminal domain-containing protein [Pseudovibrio sp. Ad13]KZK83010.1 Replicative DNA helicase [Pseudovibrio sp. Ad13]